MQAAATATGDVGTWGSGGGRTVHGARAPRIVDNIGIVLGARTNIGIARAYCIVPSTVGHWRMNGSVPLNYLSPLLKLISYDELAFGDIAQSRHANRGWTRDPEVAAKHPDEPGPINIAIKYSFEEIIARVRVLFGDDDVFHESLEANPNQMVQWRKRARVPDQVCRSFCDRHGLSLSWLLTGSDHDLSDGR